MVELSIEEVKTHFSDWVHRAMNGERIVVCEGTKPVVEIVPFLEQPGKVAYQLGFLDSLGIDVPPEVFAPLDDQETQLWEVPGIEHPTVNFGALP